MFLCQKCGAPIMALGCFCDVKRAEEKQAEAAREAARDRETMRRLDELIDLIERRLSELEECRFEKILEGLELRVARLERIK